MKKNFLSICLLIFFCYSNSIAFDPWTLGIALLRPFWDIFAKKTYDNKELKTQEARLNESIATCLAIINSEKVPEEQKIIAHKQLSRDQKAKECNDMKLNLLIIDQTAENKKMIEDFKEEIQKCTKKVLQMAQD